MPVNPSPPPCPVSLLEGPQCSENTLSSHGASAHALSPQPTAGPDLPWEHHGRAPNRGLFPLVTAEHILWHVSSIQVATHKWEGENFTSPGASIPSSSLRMRDTSLPGHSLPSHRPPQAAAIPEFCGILSLNLPRSNLTGDEGFPASTSFFYLSPSQMRPDKQQDLTQQGLREFILRHAHSQTLTAPPHQHKGQSSLLELRSPSWSSRKREKQGPWNEPGPPGLNAHQPLGDNGTETHMLEQYDIVEGTGNLFLKIRGHWEASHRQKCPGLKRPLMQLLSSPTGSPAWVWRVKVSPSQLGEGIFHSCGFQLKKVHLSPAAAGLPNAQLA